MLLAQTKTVPVRLYVFKHCWNGPILHRRPRLLASNRQVDQQVQIASTIYTQIVGCPHSRASWARRGPFNIIKGHLFYFLHRYLQEHSDIRDRLQDHTTCTCISRSSVAGCDCIVDTMDCPTGTYTTTASTSRSLSDARRRRHRKAVVTRDQFVSPRISWVTWKIAHSKWWKTTCATETACQTPGKLDKAVVGAEES
jgi:hypothetical protein